ncbi:hypothetical protein F4779DRAFT_109883 [Xylariaceae sp. FL0662B]|nr:hypothetical protein F4779DRAFT_109883 [Xylariaceae sp. FL0662B]
MYKVGSIDEDSDGGMYLGDSLSNTSRYGHDKEVIPVLTSLDFPLFSTYLLLLTEPSSCYQQTIPSILLNAESALNHICVSLVLTCILLAFSLSSQVHNQS